MFNPYRLFVGAFIPNVLMEYTGISQGAKLIWARLAQYAGEKGEAYPAIDTLAKDIGTEERQCRRYLKELENKKFIKVLRAGGKDKLLHKTNRYVFLWNAILDTYVRSRPDTYVRQRSSLVRESKEKSHTKEEEESVCEEIEKHIEKIKEIKLYKDLEAGVLKNLITQYGEEVLKAAIYIKEVNKKITVRNPEGLLITTLRNKLYSEIQENNKNNNINADVEKLNMHYRGFEVHENEKIKELLNIGGKIAFHTDNIQRGIVCTPAKTCEEFKNYLQRINSS